MSRWQRKSSLALALAIAQGAALAAVPAEAAQDLVRKSGMWLEIDSLGAQVRAGLSNALARDRGAQAGAAKARLLGCAATAYGTEPMRAISFRASAVVAPMLKKPWVTPRQSI